MLSTRPDLIGEDLAQILAKFQDKIKPFKKRQVKKTINSEFANNFDKYFKEFNFTPIASASIAQVHCAKLIDDTKVAVKILRPNIAKKVKRDIKTLKLITKVSFFISKSLNIFLNDILQLLQENSKSELDLTVEASNCSQLKDNLKNLKGFYVPQVFWSLSTKKIMVIEWLDGIPFSDKKNIIASNFDKNKIARNLVLSYFTQVYQYGFFHGDMHPGNLILLKNGDIGVVDFGIMGIIDDKTKIAIARIVIGFIEKDYNKIAQIHIDAGLVPPNTNAKKLALSCRKIGETVVGSKVKEIALGGLLQNLIKMTEEFQMSTKPELLLLQKTILLIEGIGTMLNPEINIWDYAKPWMKEWSKTHIGFDAKIVEIIKDFFKIINLSKN
jgi:ubiquinone biosynthesis protein